jgi:hypothetical protein
MKKGFFENFCESMESEERQHSLFSALDERLFFVLSSSRMMPFFRVFHESEKRQHKKSSSISKDLLILPRLRVPYLHKKILLISL